VPGGVYEAAGGYCGDETDCDPSQMLVCDLIHDAGRCVDTFYGSLGEGAPCQPGARSGGPNHACEFADGGLCALPGTAVSSGGNPCCYDRSDAGLVADCRASIPDGGTGTRTCSCSGSFCSTIVPSYVCPF
jgi:hypothetical protein